MKCSRLALLQQEIVEVGDASIEAFWMEIERNGAPIVESAGGNACNVTFLWRDQGQTSVHVVQDFGADGILEHAMSRLADSDVWHLTRTFPSDTRTTYQIAPEPLPPPHVGGFPFLLDPLNPLRAPLFLFEDGSWIPISAIALPDAPAQPWIDANAPAGTITLHTMEEDERRIWVYLPDASPGDSPLLVLLDGSIAKDLVGVPRMLDFLIAQGKVPPVVALFVDTPERDEMLCTSHFADYLAKCVVPWARRRFPVSLSPGQTFLQGASHGGLCALFTCLRHADVIGNAISHTGWFRWHPPHESEHLWLARQVIERDLQPLRIYMDVGMLETARMADGGPSQLAANRHMRDVLRAKEYDVVYWEYHGGHDAATTTSAVFESLATMLVNSAR